MYESEYYVSFELSFSVVICFCCFVSCHIWNEFEYLILGLFFLCALCTRPLDVGLQQTNFFLGLEYGKSVRYYLYRSGAKQITRTETSLWTTPLDNSGHPHTHEKSTLLLGWLPKTKLVLWSYLCFAFVTSGGVTLSVSVEFSPPK
jgi:hypothetical protein